MINQKNLILAFSGSETGRIVNSTLINNGYAIDGFFQSGSEVIRYCNSLDYGGVIICGFRLSDMTAPQMFEMLPEGFLMMMLVSSQNIGMNYSDEIFCLPLPINKADLLKSVKMVFDIENQEHLQRIVKKPVRSVEELKLINKAKAVLMYRYSMTEQQAHRFLQRMSMNSGKNILEASRIILAES